MRERVLAVLKGQPHDRVPFLQYDNLAAPNEEVWALLGREQMGIIRWVPVYRTAHPHCRFEEREIHQGDLRGIRTALHTPEGSLYKETYYDPAYNAPWIKKHYIEKMEDYDILRAYLRDGELLDNNAQILQARDSLGADGIIMASVDCTPYQHLWQEWTGLETLAYHQADEPELIEEILGLLADRARRIYDLACRAPVEIVNIPDSITAPNIGGVKFERYCLPFYQELSARMAERDIPVFAHLDGDLKPLWPAIGRSGLKGIDSLSPEPGDTSAAQAAAMWPWMRLFVNFPSLAHFDPVNEIKRKAEGLLAEAGHTGRLAIQISEDVPRSCWRTSLPVIAEAIRDFGPPGQDRS